MAVPVSALQSINPGAIIELFTLTLDSTLHGSSAVHLFHNGSNMNLNGNIVWAGNTYERFPIQCEGFDFGSTGTLPRPTISVSNIFGTITALMQAANQTTIGNDLNGSKLVRIRTLARYLDNVNFGDVETVTYTVTVIDLGGTLRFAINGSSNPVLKMKRGSKYIFDQSDSSNLNHPLRIKSDAGGEQTTTVSGTPGQAGATVTYEPAYPSAPNDLRYYCSTHGNAMGWIIQMNDPTTAPNTNPYGTPDPTAEFPQEIYFLDRKITENRDVVQWEAISALDLVNVKLPKRIATRAIFPGIGTFVG